MNALSIELSDELFDTSRSVAHCLELTQAERVRRALVNELEKIQSDWELDAVAANVEAMQRHPDHLAEVEELDTGLEKPLPEETDEGWKNWSGFNLKSVQRH